MEALLLRSLLFVILLCEVAFCSTLTFKNRGVVVKSVSLEELKKQFSIEEIGVFEPHEGKRTTYRGFSFLSLLQSIYGESWKKAEEVLFSCIDGYEPSIPLSKFREKPSSLAFERKGQEFFILDQLQQNKQVALGPFYLVWNSTEPEGSEDWPYQVISVDLIEFKDRFPKTSPPSKAGVRARRGFLAFRKHCMACHTINGEGGSKSSVELNYPISVTEYMKEEFLFKWIEDPASVRFNSTMLPVMKLNVQKNREPIIRDIIAYLKVMATDKQPPTPK